MTWRNWAWSGKFIWLLVAMLVMFAAIGIMVFLDDSTSGTERVIVSLLLVATVVFMAAFHNWITFSPGQVQVGYMPLYRKTIKIAEIARLSIVDIAPLREYGGWGVRGLAKSKNGLLLGGHPPRGLRIETHDGRRYIVTFPNLDPIIDAFAMQGCTLSPENEDVSTGKV